MARFEWVAFFERQRIHYVAQGANIGRNELGIACPWCGTSDPSQHLAISLDGNGYVCRRVPNKHFGRSAAKLVAAILHCSYERACEITGERVIHASSEATFGDKIAAMFKKPIEKPKTLSLLPEMRKLRSTDLAFIRYLVRRDYRHDEVLALAARYNLHVALQGRFRYRIIFPIEQDSKLVNWTARTITNDELRYKALTDDEAAVPLHDCVWNEKAEGDILLTVEGTFDAMRLDWYGAAFGVSAIALFGKGITQTQAAIIGKISERFKYKLSLLDKDASLDALTIYKPLALYGFKQWPSPTHVKDPAELTRQDIQKLAKQIRANVSA